MWGGVGGSTSECPALGNLGATGCVPEGEKMWTITTSSVRVGRDEVPERQSQGDRRPESETVNDGQTGW